MKTKIIFTILLLIASLSFSINYSENYFRKENAIVKDISDGDTLKVILKNKICKVRLAYIDTMETKKNRKLKKDIILFSLREKDLIEYGKKAKFFLKKELPPSTKIILYIPIHKPKDSFGRILAVVLREKDRLVINELLITTGYARTYYLKDAPPHLADFYLTLENTSKKEKRGIWKNFKE